eukprot:TRINITY_DN958_c0_g1_i1.p3 TRINITY_DN958_c0_g1~~TRINITY_DN958_c0_g1_i1.p3  ORF type:complete len:723 (-),score=106.09 TRINITY_DN958_c0_g1_i1:2285-4453(-)
MSSKRFYKRRKMNGGNVVKLINILQQPVIRVTNRQQQQLNINRIMINWYKSYDEETKDQAFKNVDYAKYSPYAEDCMFTVHYFEEIKHNFFKFEQGHVELPLNNDHFCSKCQAQLLKQSITLCTIFKTEALLCEIPLLRELAQRAVRFFEAERFYCFSFWNAVINDKQFLLSRLKCSYARFYWFLLELNTCLLSTMSDPKFETMTYKELQGFLVNSYKALILETEHFDYLYPDFVRIVKIIFEISTKLTDNIQLITSRYDSKEEPLKKDSENMSEKGKVKESKGIIGVDKIGDKAKSKEDEEESEKASSEESSKSEEEEKAVVDKAIDIGVVKKNLRKVFHEKKLQRYQKQKQKLDQQLLNKGRREMNSLKQYFTSNLEKQPSNLYYYSELLSKHHLNSVEIKAKTPLAEGGEPLISAGSSTGKQRSIFDNKEYKESPNNPNYRYERIMRMMEEKKRKNLDDYINSVSTEYLESVRDTWVNFIEPQDVEETPKVLQKDEPPEPSKNTSYAVRNLLNLLSPDMSTTRRTDTTPIKIPTVEKKKNVEGRDGDSEVSDESVFTDEEKMQDKDNVKSAVTLLGLKVLKKVKPDSATKAKGETAKGDSEQNLWFDEDKEKKKKKRERKDNTQQIKVEDWVTHFTFNELIRQKKFDVIPKKPGVRMSIDKKPNKYRVVGAKSYAAKDNGGDIFVQILQAYISLYRLYRKKLYLHIQSIQLVECNTLVS